MSGYGTTLKGSSLAEVVRRQLKLLLHHLPLARGGRARSVHQARVASRRLREALSIAGRAVPASRRLKLGRLVRRVTSALGPVREIDVALLEFDEDTLAQRWRAGAIAKIRTHLDGERNRRARDMRSALGRVDLKGLESRVDALANTCEGTTTDAWIPALTARLRKRARAFGAAVQAAGTLYAPDPLHRVRIAAKKLRYTLELTHAAADAPVGREIANLRRLQDLLGRLHDLQILEEHVRVILSQKIASSVAPALEHVNRDLEAECRTLHAQFVRRAAESLALADRAARDIPGALIQRRPKTMARMRGVRAGGSARATA